MLSVAAFLTARRASRLAHMQEYRRRLALAPYLRDAFTRTNMGKKERVYALSILVKNPSDSNNAVVTAELQLALGVASNQTLGIKISPADSQERQLAGLREEGLSFPLAINAHQTVAGWCIFIVKLELFKNSQIEGCSVLLTDTHGVAVSVGLPLIEER